MRVLLCCVVHRCYVRSGLEADSDVRWVKDCQFGGKRQAKTRWAGQGRCLFSGFLTGIEFEQASDGGRRQLGGTIVYDRGHLSYLGGRSETDDGSAAAYFGCFSRVAECVITLFLDSTSARGIFCVLLVVLRIRYLRGLARRQRRRHDWWLV